MSPAVGSGRHQNMNQTFKSRVAIEQPGFG